MSLKNRRPRVLVVYKKSAYQIYIRECRNTRVQELLDAGDPAVSTLKRAHDDHMVSMERAKIALQKLGTRALFRYRAGPVSTHEVDLVVTLGGDGTLLWASHLTGSDCPVVAINTAPKNSVGYFCASTRDQVEDTLADALAGRLPTTRLVRMSVALDGERVSNRVLNDILFCHACPAATTRFAMQLGDQEYAYKCSGIWVGPPAGSTAALQSAGGRAMPSGSRRLQFVVREAYYPPDERPVPGRGFVGPDQTLRLTNWIREGRLFIDGHHHKRSVDIGGQLSMAISDEPLALLGFRGVRRDGVDSDAQRSQASPSAGLRRQANGGQSRKANGACPDTRSAGRAPARG